MISIKNLGAAGLVLLAVVLLGSISASSALANECRRVVDNNRSSFRTSLCTGVRLRGGWVEVRAKGAEVETNVFCSEVASTEPSEYKNSSCSEKEEGTGKFTKTVELKGGWIVGGTNLSGSAELASTAKVVTSGKLTAAGVTVTCSGATLDGVGAQIESPSSGSATSLQFLGCSASSPCTLTGQNASGVIGTLPLTATAELKSGSMSAVLAHFNPKSGTQFATIAYTGSSCALSGKQPVNGKALVEGPTGQEENTEQEIVAITTEASGELKVGSSAASLSGSALLKLKSEKEWSLL